MRWPPALAAFLLCVSPLLAQQSLDELCAAYENFDRDQDGVPELVSLAPGTVQGSEGPLVLALIEQRLTESTDTLPSIVPEVERMCEDLALERWRAAPVTVSFGQQPEHRDGSVLLALRNFLQRAHADQQLAGVVLIGRFPDAFLVRTCNWRKHEALTIHKKTEREQSWKKVRFVRRVPEAVAHRCDIVLADLDGAWESLYVGPRIALPTTYAVFEDGIPAHGGEATAVQQRSVSFEDFFHVADGRLELATTAAGAPWVSLHDADADLEVAPAERGVPNALAQPEIFVSRIDPLGIALSPNMDLRDAEGRAPLDDAGRPQELRFADAKSVPSWSGGQLWKADPQLERALLIDYLDRNHAYRTGQSTVHFRPASIACDLGSGYRVLRAAAPAWKELSEAEADLRGKPTLHDYVRWMQRPAVLRTVRAHSDPWGSVFGKGELADLDALFAASEHGAPLSWTPQGDRLGPSLRKAAGGGKLDFFLLRSLWDSGLLPDSDALYLHTGCHGISPPGAESRSFQHASYGRRAGGESMLFYAQGLALIGRAKVFYDEPRGFAQELAAGHTMGEAWARYFAEEANSSWRQAGGDIGRKRSYFWSVLGDWTLRLHQDAPTAD